MGKAHLEPYLTVFSDLGADTVIQAERDSRDLRRMKRLRRVPTRWSFKSVEITATRALPLMGDSGMRCQGSRGSMGESGTHA